ncbi:NADH-quinone oxidoreductase subunit L [Mycolicibacterium aubagnense]
MHLLAHGFFNLSWAPVRWCTPWMTRPICAATADCAAPCPSRFRSVRSGYLAIIGVPPLSGFFSKDPIVEPAFAAGRQLLFGGAALLGAGITAFYADDVLRGGDWRAEAHPHESPSAVMGWPMVLLAARIIGAGALLAVGGR